MAAGNGANTFDAMQVHGEELVIAAEVACLSLNVKIGGKTCHGEEISYILLTPVITQLWLEHPAPL